MEPVDQRFGEAAQRAATTDLAPILERLDDLVEIEDEDAWAIVRAAVVSGMLVGFAAATVECTAQALESGQEAELQIDLRYPAPFEDLAP